MKARRCEKKKKSFAKNKKKEKQSAATRDRTTLVQGGSYGNHGDTHELEAKKCDKAQEEDARERKGERKGKGLVRLAKHAAVPFAIAPTGLLER